MENASKALLIAGGILIALLIITIGIVLFTHYRQIEISYNQKRESNEMQKFNANFTKFKGRQDITPQEIVTVINFAKNYKEKTGETINVEVKDKDTMLPINQESSQQNLIDDFIKSDCQKKYEVSEIEYAENGLVNSIKFQEIN